jgi:hypothetical protein
MIKNLLSTIALVCASLLANAQSFTATYDFAATTSVSGTTDPTTPPAVTGLTCGSFMAVGTGSNSSAGNRFSFNSWGTGATTTVNTYSTMTGAIDLGKYYEVTLTPQAGYTLALNSIAFTAQRSGTGIRSYVVRTSADGFTNNLPASVTTNTNLSVVGTNEFFWNLDAVTSAQNGSTISLFGIPTTSSVSFRFYAWNSEAGTGTFSIDNVVFDGSMAGTVTGLKNINSESNIAIYPVPSHDGVLFVESKNQDVTKIEVLDVLGNVVLSNVPKNESKVKINLADMPNGNYFVRMYSGNSVFTKKIAVIK